MKQFASNQHQRAAELMFRALVESLGENERQWLDQHLAECVECAQHSGQTAEMVAALKTVSISAGINLVQHTRTRVQALCMRQEARSRRMRPIWISSAFASVWMACSTPYLWQSFDLTGHWLHIPDLLWQMGFLVAWFTPALTGAAVALWLRPVLTRATPSAIVG